MGWDVVRVLRVPLPTIHRINARWFDAAFWTKIERVLTAKEP